MFAFISGFFVAGLLGKIIVKRGLIKRVIFSPDLGNILLVKKGKNWLIGEKRIKVPVAAFPDLDKKIKAIKE